MSQAAIHHIRIAPRPAAALPRVADEDIAADSSANLLLTGEHAQIHTLVRRIHDAGVRAGKPCVQVWARDLPGAPQTLVRYCSRLVKTADGGTMLVSGVDEMPAAVQHRFIDLVDDLHERLALVAARVITSTTVSLYDLVIAGRFSAPLFYRLNTIHLMLPTNCARVAEHRQTDRMTGCRPSP